MKLSRFRKLLRDDQRICIHQNDVCDVDSFEGYTCNIPKSYGHFYVLSLTTESLNGYSRLNIQLGL